MTFLRDLRNLAVLVILVVAGLGLTPRPAQAGSCPSVACGPNVTRCHVCSISVRFRCYSCYDLDQKTRCSFCTF